MCSPAVPPITDGGRLATPRARKDGGVDSHGRDGGPALAAKDEGADDHPWTPPMSVVVAIIIIIIIIINSGVFNTIVRESNGSRDIRR